MPSLRPIRNSMLVGNVGGRPLVGARHAFVAARPNPRKSQTSHRLALLAGRRKAACARTKVSSPRVYRDSRPFVRPFCDPLGTRII